MLRFWRQLVGRRIRLNELLRARHRSEVSVVPNFLGEHQGAVLGIANPPVGKAGARERLHPASALPNERSSAPGPMAIDPNRIGVGCRTDHLRERGGGWIGHGQIFGSWLPRRQRFGQPRRAA